MTKKHVLSLVLALALVVGCLAGCSGSGSSSSASSESSTQSSTASETSSETSESSETSSTASSDSSEPSSDAADVYTDEDGTTYTKFDDVQLSLLSCWNGGMKTADDQYNNDVAAAIREKIGVTVIYEGIMMNETEKLNMMFASGEMPDIVDAPYWGGYSGETAVIKKAGWEGRLTNIRDIVPQYSNISDAYDIGAVSLKYLESDIDDPNNNGARYVLPMGVSTNVADKTNWGYGVFVRGDVPEALGIDPTTIKTSEELYDFMVKARDYGFKDINGNDCIIATTYHNGWSYDNFAQSFNAKKLTSYTLLDDGTVTYDYLTEDWIEKELFIWKLVHENILDKECFTTSDDLAYQKVGNGTALFTCAQYTVTVTATKQSGLYDAHPEMRYVYVGPLQYKDGSAGSQLEPEGLNGSAVIFFPTTCSNLEAAFTYLNYVNSKEGTKLTCYGFEGDTYELNDEGQPRMNAELTEEYRTNSDGVQAQLRARGIGYMHFSVNGKNNTWFGESNPFEADAAIPEIQEYKEIHPIEILSGYSIDGLASGYENYDQISDWAFSDDTMKEYVEKAFFEETEDAARADLVAYQEYLKTNEDGIFMDFLDYMTEISTSRDDIVY